MYPPITINRRISIYAAVPVLPCLGFKASLNGGVKYPTKIINPPIKKIFRKKVGEVNLEKSIPRIQPPPFYPIKEATPIKAKIIRITTHLTALPLCPSAIGYTLFYLRNK